MNAVNFIGKKALFCLILSILCGVFLSFIDLFLSFLLQSLLLIIGISEKPIIFYGYTFPQLELNSFLLLLIFIGFFRSMINFMISQISATAYESIGARLRQLCFFGSMKSDSGYLSLSKINTQMGEIFPYTTQFFQHLALFIPQIIYGLFLLVLMFLAEPWSTAYALIGVTLISALVHFVNIRVRKISGNRPEEYQYLIHRLGQIIKNFFLLKAFRTIEDEYRRVTESSLKYAGHGLRASFLVHLAGTAPQFFGIILISILIYFNQKNLGNASSFFSFLYLFFRFLQNLGAAAASFGVINFHFPNFKKAFQFYLEFANDKKTEALLPAEKLGFFGYESTVRESHPLEKNVKNLNLPILQVKNLYYKYPSVNNFVLHDFSFQVLPGQHFGIQGESGSGKSTLIALILGILKPSRGSIEIDQKSPDEYFEDIAHCVGYVGPEPYLISGSIRENLHYGSQNKYTDEQCLEVLRKSRLTDWLSKTPSPLDYPLSEFGDGLSTGQKQRVSLARALLRDPQFLILDEVSANLDYKTEEEIAELLHTLKGKITVIIVSHREGILKYVDQKVKL